MAVKGRFEGKPWIEWAEDIRLRWQNAMDYYRRELYFEVEYYNISSSNSTSSGVH